MRGAISTQCVRTRARRELCCELHAHLPALAQQRVVHRLDLIGGELPVAVAVKALDELL
jgi:hypothetical protein